MTSGMRRWCGRLAWAALVASAGGCTLVQPVQPWEKGQLARPDMTFGADAEARYRDHIYTSREASSGGIGVGGGGCGCN